MTGPLTNNHPNQKAIPEKTIYARISDYDMVVEWDERYSLRLDIEGRWCSLRNGELFYRRLVDGQVVSYTDSTAMPENIDDSMGVHQQAQKLAQNVCELIQSAQHRLHIKGGTSEVCLDRLNQVDSWPPGRFVQLQKDFQSAYPDPVLILPPDRYRDLVLMPSRGCPNGQCSFCAFYQQQPFQILSSKDYEKHIEGVQKLFGRALGLRTGLFLGSANALAMPQKKLLDTIQMTKKSFGTWSWPRGMAAFWDPDHSPKRSVSDWKELKDAGLVRVFVGLETGYAELRKKLGKSDKIDQLIEHLMQQKESKMSLGVIVLSGLDQSQSDPTHHRMTVELIKKLRLGPKDVVYVSPFDGQKNAEFLKSDTDNLLASIRQVSNAQVAVYRIGRFRYYM